VTDVRENVAPGREPTCNKIAVIRPDAIQVSAPTARRGLDRCSSEPARFGNAGRTRLATAALSTTAILVGFGCGGTTGREDLPAQETNLGAPDVDAGIDATLSGDGGADDGQDNGAFDVTIVYADRVLPDVTPPPETGAGEAGYPWPNCPPFIAVRGGMAVPLGTERDQVPAAYTDDGGSVVAPDGSACDTYGWLTSPTVDECVTSTAGNPAYVLLPPCNWCVDAGTAVQGPRKGDSRYSICLDLYECILANQCGLSADDQSSCLCGTQSGADCANNPQPTGPCANLEIAALEEEPGSVQDALLHYDDSMDPMFLGVCGGALNQVFAFAAQGNCFEDGGGTP